MAMFGSSWNEENNDDIGPLTHWLEDWYEDVKDDTSDDKSVFSHWKDEKKIVKKRKSSEVKIKHFR